MDVAEEGIDIDVGVVDRTLVRTFAGDSRPTESNVLLPSMASDMSAISANACKAALQAA